MLEFMLVFVSSVKYMDNFVEMGKSREEHEKKWSERRFFYVFRLLDTFL